ncbi:MAG: ExeM/NucH family extracellular endonuclease [Actinomycetota bacterium]
MTRTHNSRVAAFVAITMIASLIVVMPATPARSAPTDLIISEYIEGSSNNKALEIFNGTDATVDLEAGAYQIEVYFNGSDSPGLTIDLTGTVAPGDVFVVAQSSAVSAILDEADQTNGAGWFNGNDAIVLRSDGDVVDSFGQVGVDPGGEWTGGGQDDTLRRAESVCAGDTDPDDTFDASIEWNAFPTDTFDGLGAHTVACDEPPPAPEAVINEFSASTAGTDVEYVEVHGPASTDLSHLTILQIEGDSTTGTIDEAIPVGSTDGDGFWLADLAAGTLENGTLTLLLVSDFTGSEGDDLDTDDDGTFEETPWDGIVDAVAVDDGDSGDLTYGEPALGPNYDGVSSFPPGGASRIPDGTDTDTADDWVRNDFDLAGIEGETGTPEEGEALNTPGAPNQAVEIEPPPPIGVCGDPATFIHEVQGDGAESPLEGETVTVEGIVVGDFQNNDQPDDGDLDGFHVQEEDADADDDPDTSEGVFVFAPGADDVSVGDQVRVLGSVSEFNGLTEITLDDQITCSEGNDLPGATPVTLPVDDPDEDFEAVEGMRVTFPQDLTISEYFNFDRFGEIVLTDGRQFQPTAVLEPGSDEAAALADLHQRSRITLDDGRTTQNPDPAIHPNGEEFDLDNLFRGGDLVTNATGVMDFAFGLYRIQPTQGADYTPTNPRPMEHEEVGDLEVASFNVLNYFTTLDEGPEICGPAEDQECRGADTAEELERQRAKIVAAISEMDSDVVGLIEIENHPGDVPTADLVAGLNDDLGDGTYDYIETGAIGSDAIRQALIYQPDSVEPVGDFAILDSSVDDRFDDDRNRPVLAQTFLDREDGGVFTVAVNHLKSKGSPCGAGDDDPEQGNCNLTRAEAAEAMVDWLASDPTGSGDEDFLIIGDLNAYDKEDPIEALRDGGYTDLVHKYQGEEAYSFVFDGQWGYLDHGLANPGLVGEVTGATVWHINADEPDLIDYDMTFKQDPQDALYAPDPFRSSDHDPVIVGLDVCDEVPPEVSVTLDRTVLWPPNHQYQTVNATVEATDNFDPDPSVELVSVTSNEPDNGEGDGNTVDDIVIVDDTTFQLRAERSGLGDGRVYTVTYEAEDDCGNTTQGTATVTVPLAPGELEGDRRGRSPWSLRLPT